MNLSQILSQLYDNASDAEVPSGVRGYFSAHLRNKIHGLLLDELKRSEVTNSLLSKRLKKDQAQISRLIGSPGNMTLDTISDLLLAISGATLDVTIEHPHLKGATNHRGPDWLPSYISNIVSTSPAISKVPITQGAEPTINGNSGQYKIRDHANA